MVAFLGSRTEAGPVRFPPQPRKRPHDPAV